ncbi:MAG: class I SAM-dependent methyltransferase [Gammaproteobacteria bacterium]|nr:class I SAM-dependent methyltransferase [Gammaproteobacteria bacterium]MCH9744839.1 class I SAM-dependent methyltransferase [Gammaproteobacteria bacterium]
MGLLQQIARCCQKSSNAKGARFFSDVITHVPAMERPSMSMIRNKLNLIQQSLQQNTALSNTQKAELSAVAEQLSQFELGRFLIKNQGALSGWWTYYCILGYRQYPISNPVEHFILEEAPTVLATRERFTHFQKAIRQTIMDRSQTSHSISVASIPGGMAADLLTLDCPVEPERCQLQFVNIDLDGSVFDLAKKLARDVDCSTPLECYCEDAWQLTQRNQFDVLASNGLNIYVSDRERVIALYKSFLKTLKPGGTLVTSTLTPPPGQSEACEWDFDNIDQAALAKQAGIFAHILQATWSNFCTVDEMMDRLSEAGLTDITVIPDSRRMFPTFVGIKPK